jgi:hypothetical protein
LKLYLVVDQVQVAVAVVMDLVWVVEAVVMPPRCSMLTAVTLLPDLHSLQFVLDLLVDVPAVVVATVEPIVDSMDVLLSS